NDSIPFLRDSKPRICSYYFEQLLLDVPGTTEKAVTSLLFIQAMCAFEINVSSRSRRIWQLFKSKPTLSKIDQKMNKWKHKEPFRFWTSVTQPGIQLRSLISTILSQTPPLCHYQWPFCMDTGA
ncbi:hypothetical protein HGM15179_016457, partial [Zosterops borbonicus]